MHAKRIPAVPVASFAVLLLAIYTTALLLPGSPLFARNPDAATFGLTFDLTVTVPVLFYLLVVRPVRLPTAALVPAVVMSFAGAALVLPHDRQHYLHLERALFAPAELLLAGLAVRRVQRAVRESRAAAESMDVVEVIRGAVCGGIPLARVADVVTSEVAILYYGLFSWRTRPVVGVRDLAFSYHRKSGYVALLGTLAAVTVVEAAVVHLLVQGWSRTAAWVLTALSAYGLLWLLGFLQAVRLRPILLGPDALHLRSGLRWSARIPYELISRVAPAGIAPPDRRAPGYLHAAPLGSPRLLVELDGTVDAEGLYGLTRRGVSRIGITVDDLPGFTAELEARVRAARRS